MMAESAVQAYAHAAGLSRIDGRPVELTSEDGKAGPAALSPRHPASGRNKLNLNDIGFRRLSRRRRMSRRTDRRELERQLEAKRLASEITDQTTYQRLKAFVDELSGGCDGSIAARPSKQEIRARVQQHGRPAGP
jgi:hypothetical protein